MSTYKDKYIKYKKKYLTLVGGKRKSKKKSMGLTLKYINQKHKIYNYNNFLKKIGLNPDFTYQNEEIFFLAKNPNEKYIKKDLSKIDCIKKKNWFVSLNNNKFKSFVKNKFKNYKKIQKINENDITKFYKQIKNVKIDSNDNIIIGTSDILYPFIVNKFKTLAIPDLQYTEVQNRYYLYCILQNLPKINNKPNNIIICLPNKKFLGNTNNIKSNNIIRFTTKELYTILDCIKTYKLKFNVIEKFNTNNFRLFKLSLKK